MEAIVAESGVLSGLVNVNVQGATAGIMILSPFMGVLATTRIHLFDKHPSKISLSVIDM